jgi:hypothetical protein
MAYVSIFDFGPTKSPRQNFNAGYSSRDPEVSALKAVIEKALGTLRQRRGDYSYRAIGLLASVPSSVPREQDTETLPLDLGCTMPPAGWWCSIEPGHDGPCAAREK